jgi:NAD(P)-dependent dehydrogenase (short-subunit alcohol dehydrogenase family)
MLLFKDEVAIVTGAGRGIGAAYARLLAARGARVLVNDLVDGSGDPAVTMAAEIVRAGGEAVADHNSVVDAAAALVDHAVAEFGRVDIVINNAGILSRNAFPDVSREQLQRTLDVHVAGAVAVTQAA